MHVPFAEEENELFLGEIRIHQCQWHAVKSEIPRGIPRVFPLVGDGNYVSIINVRPVAVAAALALFRGRWLRGIAGQPIPLRVVIELFGPQETSEGLTLYVAAVFRQRGWHHFGVELIRFFLPLYEDAVEFAIEWALLGCWIFFSEAQFDRGTTTRRNYGGIVRGRLRPGLCGIHGIFVSRDDVVVDTVLGVRRPRMPVEALGIRFIFGEEGLGGILAMEPEVAGFRMLECEGADLAGSVDLFYDRLGLALIPGPGIAVPNCRQKMYARRFGAAIVRSDSNKDVFRGGLGILNDDIEIAVFVEDAGIEQLKLGIFFRMAPVFFQQLSIGKGTLRIFVKKLHVRVRRRAVKVEVILLHVLAVIAFITSKAEETFFEDGISVVPKCEPEADELVTVANRGEAILVPAIGARAGVIVRKIFPCFSGGAVVLAHRSPRAIADVGAPALPMYFAGAGFFETFFFGVHSCSPRFDCFRAINLWSNAPSSLVCLRIFSSHSRAGWESSIA